VFHGGEELKYGPQGYLWHPVVSWVITKVKDERTFILLSVRRIIHTGVFICGLSINSVNFKEN
jgi:hypothetical protein